MKNMIIGFMEEAINAAPEDFDRVHKEHIQVMDFYGRGIRQPLCSDCENFGEDDMDDECCFAIGGRGWSVDGDDAVCEMFVDRFAYRVISRYFIDPELFNKYPRDLSVYDKTKVTWYKKWALQRGYKYNEETNRFEEVSDDNV